MTGMLFEMQTVICGAIWFPDNGLDSVDDISTGIPSPAHVVPKQSHRQEYNFQGDPANKN